MIRFAVRAGDRFGWSSRLGAFGALAVLAVAACSGSNTAAPDGGNPGGSDAGGTSDSSVQGDAGPGVDAGPASDLPCAVDAVFATNCRTCHGKPTAYGAPMSLVTWNDLQAPAVSDPSKKVYELVETRIHDDAKPMPQPPNPRLSTVDTATLDGWVAAGAPSSTASCTPPPTNDAGILPTSCTPDEHLTSGSPYAMDQNTDDIYVCYGVDVTRTTKRQAIAMAPRVDNKTIVHHMLLFQADQTVSPTPAACDSGGGANWRIVYVWAPGGQPLELPPEAGFPEDGTVHYVVQVHYNNINHLAGQTDSSGIDLCTTDQLRPNDADVLAFGSEKFTIPPHGTLDTTCSVTIPSELDGLHAFAVMPHMHKLGTTLTTVDLPGGTGAPVDLGSDPTFSFQSQTWLSVSTIIHANDVVNTRCVWNNTTDQAVKFGTGTEDEMCFSFTMYYPKITDSLWNWALPSLTSTCK